MIRFSAPAKVMLTGEYAVLDGAPALMMALNRRAYATFIPEGHETDTATELLQGAVAREAQVNRLAVISDLPKAMQSQVTKVVTACCAVLEIAGEFPLPGTLYLQSAQFHQAGLKLGIGSSAAIAVAALAALATACNRLDELTLNNYIEAHNLLQGKGGSGADVAVCVHGGSLIFRKDQILPVTPLHDDLPLAQQMYFVGASASTMSLVGTYRQFKETQAEADALVKALCASAERVAAVATSAVGNSASGGDRTGDGHGGELLRVFADYANHTRDMARAASLPVYCQPHEDLFKTAQAMGVVYKTCGAGGGDMGMAFHCDPDVLAQFTEKVANETVRAVDLKEDRRGVQLETAA